MNLAALLTPFVIQLINEFRHRDDVITPEEVKRRLDELINRSQAKIDEAVANIGAKKNRAGSE